MKRFEGKLGFVTGGGTGIGFGCATEIVAGGGRVTIAGRRADVLEKAAAALGPQASWVQCDVTSDESVDGAVATAVERMGGLNLAVNSAGFGTIGSVLNSTAQEFNMVVDANLTGVFRCLRAEAKAMKPRGGGSIVNISSIAGALTHRWMTAYCASKAGVNMLTACAADDLGEHGIRVNAVMPSLVPTELTSPIVTAEAMTDEYKRRMPLARIGTVEEVSALVAFLLSDEARWITGQCIAVDGGHTLRQGPDLVPQYREFYPEER